MNLCNKIYKTLLNDFVFVCHTRWWLQCLSSKLTLMSLVQVSECTSELLRWILAHGEIVFVDYFCLYLPQPEVQYHYDWNINQCTTLQIYYPFEFFLKNLWEGATGRNWTQVMYAMFWFILWWWSSVSHTYVLFVDM
jgi:hypothetical protein